MAHVLAPLAPDEQQTVSQTNQSENSNKESDCDSNIMYYGCDGETVPTDYVPERKLPDWW